MSKFYVIKIPWTLHFSVFPLLCKLFTSMHKLPLLICIDASTEISENKLRSSENFFNYFVEKGVKFHLPNHKSFTFVLLTSFILFQIYGCLIKFTNWYHKKIMFSLVKVWKRGLCFMNVSIFHNNYFLFLHVEFIPSMWPINIQMAAKGCKVRICSTPKNLLIYHW